MSNIAIIGPPGSGKSTVGKQMAMQLGMIYVSSGDIARRLAETDEFTNNSLMVGGMASEDKMRSEIHSILYDISYRKQSFILDGFPRNTEQYLWLRKRFPDITYIMIDSPAKDCSNRMLDRCREDDCDFIIQSRIKYYVGHTKPMISCIGLIKKYHNLFTVKDLVDCIIEDNK